MLQSIIERARKQLLKAVDPSFIQHKTKTRRLPVDNVGGAQYNTTKKTKVKGKVQWEVSFKTDSATRSGIKTHTQRIVLLELRPLIESKRSKLTLTQKTNKAINRGDLLIGCTCEAFLYWGYAWINSSLGTVHPKFRERRPPNERNPQRRGIMCKHLALSMGTLPFNTSSIVKDLRAKGVK